MVITWTNMNTCPCGRGDAGNSPSEVTLLYRVHLWLAVLPVGKWCRETSHVCKLSVPCCVIPNREERMVSRRTEGVCSSRGKLHGSVNWNRAVCVKAYTSPKVKRASQPQLRALRTRLEHVLNTCGTILRVICEDVQMWFVKDIRRNTEVPNWGWWLLLVKAGIAVGKAYHGLFTVCPVSFH